MTFSLFSNKISLDDKYHMAAHILTFSPPDDYGLGKPDFQELSEETSLVDLLGPKSFLLFKLLEIQPTFFQENPEHWNDFEEYQTALNFVRIVKITNDTAERGCHLITEYATLLTKDERQS